MRVLHANGAMVTADSGAARAGGGATAGSARRGAAGIGGGGFIAGTAVLAVGWESVWWGGRRACCGSRDLVGTAAGLVGENSGDDGSNEAVILLVCVAAELRGDAVLDSGSTLKKARKGFNTEFAAFGYRRRREAESESVWRCCNLRICGAGAAGSMGRPT